MTEKIGKKQGNGNGKVHARGGFSDFDRVMLGLGPSETTSGGPGDLDRIDRELKRLPKSKG